MGTISIFFSSAGNALVNSGSCGTSEPAVTRSYFRVRALSTETLSKDLGHGSAELRKVRFRFYERKLGNGEFQQRNVARLSRLVCDATLNLRVAHFAAAKRARNSATGDKRREELIIN